MRERGTVNKWFKAEKADQAARDKKFGENNTGKSGFGFIWGQSGRDYFVHWTMIEGTGFRKLCEGQVVEFTPDEVTGKGWQAKQVVILEDVQ